MRTLFFFYLYFFIIIVYLEGYSLLIIKQDCFYVWEITPKIDQK